MPSKLTEPFLRKRSSQILLEKAKEISIFNPEAESSIPRFDPTELDFGKYLGSGGFCDVSEVKKVTLNKKSLGEIAADAGTKVESFVVSQDKSYISQNFIREGQARYAIKKLKSDIFAKGDPQHFVSGVIDLAMEVKYLAVLQHPHIIKMRAIASTNHCSDRFFIVMDKLYDTMDDRILSWKKSAGKLMIKKADKEDLLIARMTAAYDISTALIFMHEQKIIYRDLKPENIGFDIRDDVKVFDFGLATEMKEDTRVKGTNLFKLTGETGSPRYMAPEVALSQPYNETSDAYAFSLLLSYMLEMKQPFDGYNFAKMNQKVYKGNDRPKIGSKIAKSIANMLTSGWSKNISKRPQVKEMGEILYKEIVDLTGDNELLDVTNRTEMSMNARNSR
jgi:serine/threonine protein kinase